VIAYTVYESSSPPDDHMARAERFVFVKEGFSAFAALLPPLWMIVNRLWIALLLYIAALLALEVVLVRLAARPDWRTFAVAIIHIAVGLEAGGLRRWGLRRRGWRIVGSVVGRSAADCERRFFEGWMGPRPDAAALAGPAPSEVAPIGASPPEPSISVRRYWPRWLPGGA
jgi:hypothetical protein